MTYLETCLSCVALVTLLLVVVVGLQIMIGNRRIRQLTSIEPVDKGLWPKVSIIVAARNEEQNIEAGLRSLCMQHYEETEIIAVNDRSSDQTGRIMDRVAEAQSRLRIVHVTQLPAGWLGKNHALQLGADKAAGEYLLFTDADVVMDPTVVRRAIRYAVDNDIDHLAILPRIIMPNWFLESFVVTFALYFSAFFQPWKVKDPKSRHFVGVGAFNLVRANVYQSIGQHQAIAMRPDDDVKLGKIVKNHGYRQEMMFSGDLMHVPWYGSLSEVIVGLEKNAFSGVDYSVLMIVVSSFVALAAHVWPFVAIFVTGGVTWWLYLAVAVWMLVLVTDTAIGGKFRPWCSIAFPITVMIFVYIQWRAMILAFWNNGIRWRDTHYPLAELKANKV